MNPLPHTLRELKWMAEAKGLHDWTIASNMMAMYINMNSKTKVSPVDFNPYAPKRSSETRMLKGKAAWDALRMIFSEGKR